MSTQRTQFENAREFYGPRFLVAPIEDGTEILFDGSLLITIERDERLPAGFNDRLVRHIMDLLTGRRSALWDEQAVFGDRAADSELIRALARAVANELADERERGLHATPREQTAGSFREAPETDTAGCA